MDTLKTLLPGGYYKYTSDQFKEAVEKGTTISQELCELIEEDLSPFSEFV